MPIKPESKAIDKFKKTLKGVFYLHKIHSGGFGVSGFPDLYLKLRSIPASFLIEMKVASSCQEALKKRLPSQIGMAKVLGNVGADYILMWDNGSNAFPCWYKEKEYASFEALINDFPAVI